MSVIQWVPMSGILKVCNLEIRLDLLLATLLVIQMDLKMGHTLDLRKGQRLVQYWAMMMGILLEILWVCLLVRTILLGCGLEKSQLDQTMAHMKARKSE